MPGPTVHPLNPLTAQEIHTAGQVVQGDDRWCDTHWLCDVRLWESHNDDTPQDAREADVVLVDRASGQASEIRLDLITGEVLLWKDHDSVYSAYLLSEYADAIAVTNTGQLVITMCMSMDEPWPRTGCQL